MILKFLGQSYDAFDLTRRSKANKIESKSQKWYESKAYYIQKHAKVAFLHIFTHLRGQRSKSDMLCISFYTTLTFDSLPYLKGQNIMNFEKEWFHI